jgi:asparagine N-glycosylation enzyme membrane subunit Stt3
MMGSIGFISTPSFLINHALLRSSLGLLLIVVSIILGALAYHISKTDSKKGSMLAILASLILPVDVFMLAGGALLFISKK